MMHKFDISITETFKDNLKKLSTEERELVKRKLELLAENPYHPSLRSKKVTGTAERFESSVNMDIRIIWQYAAGRIIVALEIGHHDIFKKY
jgi:mRNA-degrading endonuclease RelE of RelBE toxin-antitoxin system